MAIMCRRSDNACQSVVALDLTGTGGGAASFFAELQSLLTDLRKKCSACLRNDTPCIRFCDNNCSNFCDGCHACQRCREESSICKRVTIDTAGMDCASVQWSVMQSSPADVIELGLNLGFVPDIGHTVRLVSFVIRALRHDDHHLTTYLLFTLSFQVKNAVDGLRRGYILTEYGAAGLYMLRVLLEDKETRHLLPPKLTVHDISGAYRLSHSSVERILNSATVLGSGSMLVTKTDAFKNCCALAISPQLDSVLFGKATAVGHTTQVSVISKRTNTATTSWELQHDVRAACFVAKSLVFLSNSGCFRIDADDVGAANFKATPTKLLLAFYLDIPGDTTVTSIASDGDVLYLGTPCGLFKAPLPADAREVIRLVVVHNSLPNVKAVVVGCGVLAVYCADGKLRIHQGDAIYQIQHLFRISEWA